jgi:hypothetical protein
VRVTRAMVPRRRSLFRAGSDPSSGVGDAVKFFTLPYVGARLASVWQRRAAFLDVSSLNLAALRGGFLPPVIALPGGERTEDGDRGRSREAARLLPIRCRPGVSLVCFDSPPDETSFLLPSPEGRCPK